MSNENVTAALIAAQSEFQSVHMTGRNKNQKYPYATAQDIIDAARPVLARHGLGVVLSADQVENLDARSTQSGNTMHRVRVKATGHLMHKSGEVLSFAALGDGESDTDKAIYKAQTGARKYLYLSIMGVATTDDPEHDGGAHLSVGRIPESPPTPPVVPEGFKEVETVVNEAFSGPPKEGLQEKLARNTANAPPAPPEKEVQEVGLEFDKWGGFTLFKKDDSPTWAQCIADQNTDPLVWVRDKMTKAPKAQLKARYCLWKIAYDQWKASGGDKPPVRPDLTDDEIPF